MAANIGAAYEKSFLAYADGDTERGTEWDTLAADITYLARNAARDAWVPDALDEEYRKLMDRWDALNQK